MKCVEHCLVYMLLFVRYKPCSAINQSIRLTYMELKQHAERRFVKCDSTRHKIFHHLNVKLFRVSSQLQTE